ncbi:MAG: alkaline phosphatase PhoX [Solirubrobacterales bacterium]
MRANAKWIIGLLVAIVIGVGLALVIGAGDDGATGFRTAAKPYAVPVGDQYEVEPLLSVGDRVANTSDPSAEYQMIGVPDGLGVRADANGTIDLYMNHELLKTETSEPNVGGPLDRGAFVSKYRLASDGSVLSGERAYDTVYAEDARLGPAAAASNSTAAFSYFCSGFLADERVGFDRPIYLAGEEASGAETFDGRGGQSVAIFDHELHTLPRLGRFQKENEVVVPRTGRDTVVFPLEDVSGDRGRPESQLYLYVGRKDPGSASVLRRNGLDNGSLYVLVLQGHSTEADFAEGRADGRWVKIPDAAGMTDAQLEAASDAAGAFAFVRIEDGASSKTSPSDFYFVTTGDAAANRLGRLYHLEINPGNAPQPAELSVVFNADEIVTTGRDIAISPDNVDTSGDYLMINEDGTDSGRRVMDEKGRDGSVWRFDLEDGFTGERIAELNPPGRDDTAIDPGTWETSGIIDVSSLFGADTWIFDVQAHSPTAAPAPKAVEDGQLVLMRPAN